MPVDLATLAPLLRGTYGGRDAAAAVIWEHGLPTIQRIARRLHQKSPGFFSRHVGNAEALGMEAVSELIRRAEEEQGLPLDNNWARGDSYLARATLDTIRALAKRYRLQEKRESSAAGEPELELDRPWFDRVGTHDRLRSRLHTDEPLSRDRALGLLVEVLAAVKGFKALAYLLDRFPPGVDRPLVSRASSDSTATWGLARPEPETWELLVDWRERHGRLTVFAANRGVAWVLRTSDQTNAETFYLKHRAAMTTAMDAVLCWRRDVEARLGEALS